MENRFLFVIDTSSAMKSRSNGVVEAVTGLLASDIKGELRKGDTIGLWTYGVQLNTDFPMRVWSNDKKDAILKEARHHLDSLRYEKRSHLDKVLPEIGKVVANSDRLTVILVFDGSEPITGTPFDTDINDLHKAYARKFRAVHQPFVTVLASRNGGFFDYTINYPSVVVIPHTADPLPPPETNTPPPVVAAAPPPPPIALPPAQPAHKLEIVLSGSDFPHNAPTPPPAASNVETVVAPTPVPAPVVPANPPPAPEAAPVALQAATPSVAPPESEQTPPPAPIAPALAKPVPAAPPPPSNLPAVAVVPAVVKVPAGQQAAMFIMAFSLLTIAIVLVIFLVRRRKAGSQPSLISQSIDRSR
jgi:hypothetical protein